jgi:hypothetical protein
MGLFDDALEAAGRAGPRTEEELRAAALEAVAEGLALWCGRMGVPEVPRFGVTGVHFVAADPGAGVVATGIAAFTFTIDGIPFDGSVSVGAGQAGIIPATVYYKKRYVASLAELGDLLRSDVRP